MKSFYISCICLLGLGAVTVANANDFEAALSSDTRSFLLPEMDLWMPFVRR